MATHFFRRRIKAGTSVLETAFGPFREGLYRYLLHRLRNAESAEDLTQEVYLRLHRGAERTLVSNPQAYVFGVAFNVLSEFRLHEAHSPIDFDSATVERISEQLTDAAETPEQIQDRLELARWLDGVLARLSPMQKAVLLMAKRQGLTHAEIALKLGIAVGTVRKHLARAIAQCRKASVE
jgi:RNA polymerase sigma-19 factor, ECF subfamily